MQEIISPMHLIDIPTSESGNIIFSINIDIWAHFSHGADHINVTDTIWEYNQTDGNSSILRNSVFNNTVIALLERSVYFVCSAKDFFFLKVCGFQDSGKCHTPSINFHNFLSFCNPHTYYFEMLNEVLQSAGLCLQ